jgi:isocitrate dehydrogenase (NAD+)
MAAMLLRTSARHRPARHRQKCTASPARDVLVFDGDGVGPEIITAARRVADAALSVAGVRGIRWIEMAGYGYDNGLGVTEAHLEAFGEVGVLLKGPLSIPAGTSGSVIEARGQAFTSANQALRQLFGLYANVRPARSYALPWPTRFGDVAVDLLIVRENTEDLYCGAPEVWVDKDTCQATKRISRGASARIAEYACALALQRQAERGAPSLVTAVHKANVCKQ